jgi:prostaglandin-endoperoxide synthase 2
VIDGEEYPPDLYDASGQRVPQFKDLRVIGADDPGVDRSQLLAMGSDTSNTQIGYAMLNVLFLREHNRVAREIRASEPTWSDDRVFDAARSVLNVVLIKVLIEDYIHHISPYRFRFTFAPHAFARSRWNRPNFVAVEFNLLYRWHSMIPPTFRIGGQDVGLEDTTMYRTKALLTGRGLGGLFEDASGQACGQVGLFNTGSPLLERAELATIEEARDVRVRGVNDYLTRYKFPRARRFEDFSSDPRVVDGLRRTYRDPDDVELYVGLFAGDIPRRSILAPLMERMLAIHAFSQLMTHPLLGQAVCTADTFSRRGLEMIEQTTSIAQLLRRNVPAGKADGYVSLTRQGWHER